jgi:Flp pilus assembly protein TadD
MGDLEQAVVAFRRAIDIDPSTGQYHENLAYSLYLLNRLAEAEAEAQKAVALDRTDPAARYMLGFLLVAHPERREEALENLLYAARQIREARLVLAVVYHLSGADARAAAELQLYHAPSLMADKTH